VVRDIVTTLKDKRLAAFSVYIPMLIGDSKSPALESAKNMKDAGIASFWDGDRSLGKAYGQTVTLPEGKKTAWDIYSIYGPDAIWDKTPPKPVFWMHQLGLDDRRLDPERFRAAVELQLKNLQ